MQLARPASSSSVPGLDTRWCGRENFTRIVDALDTSSALIIVGGAILVGLVVVSVALTQLSGAMKRLMQIADDLRTSLQMMQENQAHETERRMALEKRRLEIAEKDREAGVVVRMRGTLTLLEDSQEFKASYFILVMGRRQVLAERVRVLLVNDRDPELVVTLDATGGLVLDPSIPHDGEVTISVRDLARINLPFVPEFKFLRESSRLLVSVEYEDGEGTVATVEKNLLER